MIKDHLGVLSFQDLWKLADSTTTATMDERSNEIFQDRFTVEVSIAGIMSWVIAAGSSSQQLGEDRAGSIRQAVDQLHLEPQALAESLCWMTEGRAKVWVQ